MLNPDQLHCITLHLDDEGYLHTMHFKNHHKNLDVFLVGILQTVMCQTNSINKHLTLGKCLACFGLDIFCLCALHN